MDLLHSFKIHDLFVWEIFFDLHIKGYIIGYKFSAEMLQPQYKFSSLKMFKRKLNQIDRFFLILVFFECYEPCLFKYVRLCSKTKLLCIFFFNGGIDVPSQ